MGILEANKSNMKATCTQQYHYKWKQSCEYVAIRLVELHRIENILYKPRARIVANCYYYIRSRSRKLDIPLNCLLQPCRHGLVRRNYRPKLRYIRSQSSRSICKCVVNCIDIQIYQKIYGIQLLFTKLLHACLDEKSSLYV